MSKWAKQSKQKSILTVIDRAFKTIRFAESRRQFTLPELMEELELNDDQTARRYLDALSIQWPVIEISPRTYDTASGSSPAIYAMQL